MIVPTQGSPTEPPFLIVRLSVLIFMAFAIMGAWVPVFTWHLELLHFSPEATAWASAGNAIGALLAPLVWGQVADRWLPMERCVSLCALATGVGLFLLAELTKPAAVIFVCISMWFFLIPTIGLSTSLIFRQLEHPERDYGKIRMWGTVGWMVASWCLTAWFTLHGRYSGAEPNFADSLRLGGVAAFVLTLYAWTLPHTPATGSAASARPWYARLADAPLSSLRLFRDRSFVVYCVCMFGFHVTLTFTVQLNPLLLKRLEIDPKVSSLYLTICQTTEVLFLYLLPMLLMRYGTRSVMLAGGLSWVVGLGLLSVGAPVWLVLGSFITAGVFVCCFFIAGQVYVNQQATHDIRASAQGLLWFIAGIGLLLGHLLVGWIRDWTEDRYDIAYGVAAMVAAVLTVLLLIGFSGAASNSRQESLVPGPKIT